MPSQHLPSHVREWVSLPHHSHVSMQAHAAPPPDLRGCYRPTMKLAGRHMHAVCLYSVDSESGGPSSALSAAAAGRFRATVATRGSSTAWSQIIPAAGRDLSSIATYLSLPRAVYGSSTHMLRKSCHVAPLSPHSWFTSLQGDVPGVRSHSPLSPVF